MGSNCGYDFFMVLGTIGKSLMFLFMVLDMIFLMALDTFFYGFGYFFTIFLWVWNGFGQNRTKIVILAKKRF